MAKSIVNKPWLSSRWLLPASVFLILLLLQISGYSNQLSLNRDSVAAGQWWLLITANFVHLNSPHLLMNLAAYGLLVAALQGDTDWRQHALGIVICALAVGLGVWVFAQGIGLYAGFSGILHGLMVLFALNMRQQTPLLAWAALTVVCAKVSHELLVGASATTAALISAEVVVESHLAGLLGGGVAYILFK